MCCPPCALAEVDEIRTRKEMKEEAGRDLRGNGMRNESRTLKGRQRRRSKMGAACIPLLLFCFNRSWQHSGRPGWHWGNKDSPPCTVTHPAGASKWTLRCQTLSHYHYYVFFLLQSTLILSFTSAQLSLVSDLLSFYLITKLVHLLT